jgi:hypothetical protein
MGKEGNFRGHTIIKSEVKITAIAVKFSIDKTRNLFHTVAILSEVRRFHRFAVFRFCSPAIRRGFFVR